MIEKFPSNIEVVLKTELPDTHAMWWVRGVVISVGEIERATANPEKDNPGGRLRNRVIQIGDLDRDSDGYDLEIEGVTFPIQRDDVVSLLGHEEKGADQVSAPRLIINHSTGGLIERVYPLAKSLDWGVLPMVERKYWLAAKTPANPSEKLKNLWIALAVVLLPFILLGFVAGPYGPLVLLAILLFVAGPLVFRQILISKYLDWIEAQPPFSFETKLPGLLTQNYRAFVNFKRHDLTPLYEKLARVLHVHAVKNPAPEVEFVIEDRGAHTNGLLSASEAAPIADKTVMLPTVVPTQKLPTDTNANGGVAS